MVTGDFLLIEVQSDWKRDRDSFTKPLCKHRHTNHHLSVNVKPQKTELVFSSYSERSWWCCRRARHQLNPVTHTHVNIIITMMFDIYYSSVYLPHLFQCGIHSGIYTWKTDECYRHCSTHNRTPTHTRSTLYYKEKVYLACWDTRIRWFSSSLTITSKWQIWRRHIDHVITVTTCSVWIRDDRMSMNTQTRRTFCIRITSVCVSDQQRHTETRSYWTIRDKPSSPLELITLQLSDCAESSSESLF